jgi:ornithine cyclodeaminase/alanine dehydrogenase
MPAYVGWLDTAGTKWAVATWEQETEPISSLQLLFDLDAGRFTAVMEGMYLTGVRTAMQSVVGLRRLIPAAPETVGIFGAGFQGRFQVEVIDALVDVDEIRLFDVDSEAAARVAEQTGDDLDADLTVCDTPASTAVADAVVTVTDSQTPVVDHAAVADSSIVIALGTYQELQDETVLGTDRIVVDHPEQCLNRGALSSLAARNELGQDDLDATIGEVMADNRGPVIGADEQCLFVPLGLGGLDVAIAEHVRRETDPDAVNTFAFD